MSEPIALISNSQLTAQDFFDFLPSTGAVIASQDNYEGRLSKDKSHVWIFLSNESLQELEEEDVETIAQQLGGIPKTYIVLEISDTPGSEQLAVEFACAFAERWTSLVCDSQDEVYSLNELYKLRDAGKGFEK